MQRPSGFSRVGRLRDFAEQRVLVTNLGRLREGIDSGSSLENPAAHADVLAQNPIT